MPRPTVVTVFGILNLTFALLGLCGLAIASPILVLKEGSDAADPMYATLLEHPVYLVYTKVSMLAGGVLNVLLAASGVGLLLMKSWGRRLAVFYAAFAVLMGALGLLLQATVYAPAVMQNAEKMAEGPVKTGLLFGTYIGLAIGAACGLGFPIVLLICMTRQKFVALFGPQAPDAPPLAPDAPPPAAPPAA